MTRYYPTRPGPAGRKGGKTETHCRRTIVDAIFYVVDNGIKRRALPADFPSWSTVYNYFAAWEAAGITQQALDELRDRVRLREDRTAEPSAAINDGRKRHIAVDTLGLPLCVLVSAASVQDRAGARPGLGG